MAERMNTESLRYVQAVVETGSFSAAARAYGVTQPALSNGIARLEEHLGESLFERSPRGVSLTPFGAFLLPYIESGLQGFDAIATQAKRWTSGTNSTIRMGVSPLISPALVARAYSAVCGLGPADTSRDLVLREANLAELRKALIADELDLIVIPSVGPLPRYEHRVIDSEPVVFVESEPGTDAPIELGEIAERQLILVPDTCGLTTFTRDLLASHELPMRTYPGEALSYRVLEEWSTLGLGAALLPISRVTDAGHRRVVDDGTDVEIFYEAVWDPSSRMATEFEELVGLLRNVASA
ncbi:LysR family transcriptional regulator [Leucobacter ruminantium]|uniref:LysR family transcriptional regulator n=1 Tax=Leucobacter ruminantium TaxID=1289170 RepID=A0A939LUC5_9MICO|nr:LysR family transcriptional regulator [Leucobacter ruminantium]MBO1804536.1 LysR family transcriptional regulator [Leucobacter ruminantium]